MLAQTLISEIVPVVRTSDSGQAALSLMEVFKVAHMPIVNNVDFLGLISDNDIYDLNMAESPIGDHPLSLIRPYVYADQHIYEVIDVVSRLGLTLIPVLERDDLYMGSITLQDLVQKFAELASANNPGGIILLEMHIHDYTLTEISQIIEGNDAKILSLYASSHADSTKVNVTIKVNRNDLSSIIQTFDRYGYNIIATYSEDQIIENMMSSRYEEFMNFLNI